MKLNPKLVESHNNRGNALKLLGRIKEARAEYCKALQINPDYVDGRLNKSIMDLEHGDFVEGFKDYESRWRSGQLQPRGFPCPNWEGEDLNGKRLLLWAEQGLGDAVQFVRFASQIKKLYPYTKIAVEVRGTLAKLCSTVPGVDEVVEYGENPREADYACAMLSAPRILKTTMESIPAPQRYMWPSPYRIQVWRDRIKTDLANLGAKMLIGICWSGQSRPLQPVANSIDARRSTALAQWQPLALPGVVFVSLQTGAGLAQVKTPPVGMTIADFSDNFDDFADTAALMECLDLIISGDTAVPHVAAACGRPVWMLSRVGGCWRWHGDREDSPGDSTLREFRQKNYVEVEWGGEGRVQWREREVQDSDKEVWPRQWNAFVNEGVYVPEGTAIAMLFPVEPQIADMLRGIGVHTVEQLSKLTATAVEHIGMGGQEWVNKAKNYITTAQKGVDYHVIDKLKAQHSHEIGALNSEILALTQQMQEMKGSMMAASPGFANAEFARLQALEKLQAVPQRAAPETKPWQEAPAGFIEEEPKAAPVGIIREDVTFKK